MLPARPFRFARYPGQSARIIFAPLFIAQKRGYFTDEGLVVEVVEPEDHPWQCVARGGAEAGVGYIDYCARPEYFDRFKAVAVAERLLPGRGLPALLARPALVESGALAGPDGLRGRKIGLSWGRGDDYLTYYGVLHPGGLTLDDVTMVAVPHEGAERHAALANGEIDVIIGRRPRQIAQEEAAGVLRRWKNGSEIFPDWQNRFIVFSTDVTANAADAGRAFLRAYARGARDYVAGTPGGAVAESFLPFLAEISEEEPELLRRCPAAGFLVDCAIDVAALERDIALLAAVELFPPKLRARDVVDERFDFTTHS
jgi:ABC-type nitrate/sulfonate/bicarbonate transport system substrate-binding protein